MKRKISEEIRHLLWLALWIVPVPFGAFSTDRVGLVSLSLLLFLLLSILVPILVRRRQIKKTGESPYVRTPFLLYGGFVGLFVGIGILSGLMAVDNWKIYSCRLVLYTIWMILFLALQQALSILFSYWHQHRRSFWYSEFLDPILYSLPLPCAVLGMFLFPSVSATDISGQLLIGIAVIMSSSIYLFAVFVLAVFAFYFYPVKTVGINIKMRALYFVRIFIMATVWIAVNVMIFSVKTEMMGRVLFTAVPVLQNDLLVFISPFVFEGIVIIVSVAVGNIFLLPFQKRS